MKKDLKDSLLYELLKKPYRWFLSRINNDYREFELHLKEISKFDQKYKTDFGGRLSQRSMGFSHNQGNDYTASPSYIIEGLCDVKDFSGKTVLDLGCGKGYAMYLLGKYGFARVLGLDISEELCQIAKNNLSKLENDYPARFDVCQADIMSIENNEEALNMINTSDFFYIYNSFPRNVMARVISLLEKSVVENPRTIVVWYVFPEAVDLLLEKSNFVLVRQYFSEANRGGAYEFILRDSQD